MVYLQTKSAAKSLSCVRPTLCDPIDGSPPGSPVPGILQAKTLEWVAISFSSAWKWKVKVKSLSRVQLFETPWTAAYQAPPSMGFSRQEYWSGEELNLGSLKHLSSRLKPLGFPGGSVSAESACSAGAWLQCRRPGPGPWVGKIPWRRKWHPTPGFFPDGSHLKPLLLLKYSPEILNHYC